LGVKQLLHVLAVSASVTRLRWRPPANESFALDDEDRHDAMLAVSTAPIKGASAGGSGVLALWSYYRPFMPLSVLQGHKEGAVNDFDWLETPINPTDSKPFSKATSPARKSRRGQLLDTNETERGTGRIAGAAHEADAILYDNTDPGEAQKPVGIWQHALSVGRDGRCLVQSFVRGTTTTSHYYRLLCIANSNFVSE
jgi:hypothetical protein